MAVYRFKVILEDHEDIFGQIDPVGKGRRESGRIDALQEDLGEATDDLVPVAAAGERHRIAPGEPDQRRDADDGQHLHQHRQHVLGADQAAIEERKRRNRHHQHEG